MCKSVNIKNSLSLIHFQTLRPNKLLVNQRHNCKQSAKNVKKRNYIKLN